MKNIKKANLADPDTRECVIYNDGELALCRDIHELLTHMQPVQLEMYVAALVEEGVASVCVNGITYEARRGDLVIFQPDNIVEQGLISLNFKGSFIFISMDYAQRILPLSESMWNLKALFERSPLCRLNAEEASVFSQYYSLLCAKASRPCPVKRVIDSLVLAFLYDMNHLLNQYVKAGPSPFSAGETLFRRFIGLLSASYPKPRRVSYYAGRLNVTPKYLSAVCKQVGGMRPSKIIDSYVLRDIDYLMRHTQMSIKEIAYELRFSNLSVFGKYVRKHRSVSPRSYRMRCLGNEACGAAPQGGPDDEGPSAD